MRVPIFFSDKYFKEQALIKEEDKKALEQLGIKLSKVEQKGSYFYAYLELPETMHCKEEYLDFSHRSLTVYAAGIPIITVNQNNDLRSRYIQSISYYLNKEMNIENIKEALKKKELDSQSTL